MNTKRLWMFGCIGFAALSIVLAISSATTGFSQYAGDLHLRFVRDQRDTLFRLIAEIEPKLSAEQVETALRTANRRFETTEKAIRVGNGIEFVVADKTIKSVRSSTF